MDTDDGCTEYAGDEHSARGGGAGASGSIAGVPAPPVQDRIEAFLAKCRAEQSIAPDATRARIPSVRERLEAQAVKWRRDMDVAGQAEAYQRKNLQDKVTSRRARAFGLAVADPDNMEQHAIEAGIEPDVLADALRTNAGRMIGQAMFGTLRDCGALEQGEAARLKQVLIETISQGVNDGTVSPGLAPKVLEVVSELAATKASKPGEVLPPARFKGTAAELIAEIDAWADEQSGIVLRASS